MNAFIIAGFRSAVGKAPRGKFRFTRPDDLAAKVIQHLMSTVPNPARGGMDDPAKAGQVVIPAGAGQAVGNATPDRASSSN